MLLRRWAVRGRLILTVFAALATVVDSCPLLAFHPLRFFIVSWLSLLLTYLARFGGSNLHQRDPRSALFEGYVGPGADVNANANQRNMNASPNRFGTPGSSAGGYGYGYPGGNGNTMTPQNGGYRSATPNRRGQYSDAVLNELESQNDQQIEGILGKVRILKDVRHNRGTLVCLATLSQA